MHRVLLNNVDHADLRVAIRAGAAFDSINQVPLYPSEFEEAQRSFPIIFRRAADGIQAYALLGLDRDENLFLEGERWTSAYVPAFQRRGPFSIGIAHHDDGDPDTGEQMLYIDLDDPRVGVADGLPLFREHGGNAPLLTHIIDVLRVIVDGRQSAPALYQAWEDAGLLRPVAMQIDLGNDQTYEVPDLLMMDREALAALEGERLEQLHRSGQLETAILVAASLGNVQRLVELKTVRQAGL